MPSRSANSIHVSRMCEAFSKSGHDVTLFSGSAAGDQSEQSLSDYYGVDFSNIDVETTVAKGRGLEFRIALLSVICFITSIVKCCMPDIIFSRNLYAAFFFALFLRQRVIYESHSPDVGFRRILQKMVMNSRKVKTVVISEALKSILMKYHNLKQVDVDVFHDAAPSGRSTQSNVERENIRKTLLKSVDTDAVVGYFGHLYSGRGLEVIQAMAKARPQISFLIFGGNEKDILSHRKENKLDNLHFEGHIAHKQAIKLMSAMDVLLMPYQRQVSIGISGHDTAKWMSPMKMFEYLAAAVPIISSDLPVLTEVLHNGKNALLVPPDNHALWIASLDKIVNKPALAKSLAKQGYEDYLSKYTWDIRCQNILKGMSGYQ